MAADTTLAPLVLDASAFLDHWQGHRRLTRRIIEAFPERELFHFTIGGMRSFAAMAFELIEIAAGGVRGVATADDGDRHRPLDAGQLIGAGVGHDADGPALGRGAAHDGAVQEDAAAPATSIMRSRLSGANVASCGTKKPVINSGALVSHSDAG